MEVMLGVLRQQQLMMHPPRNSSLILHQEVQLNSGQEVLVKQQLIVFCMPDLSQKGLIMESLLSLSKSETSKHTLHFRGSKLVTLVAKLVS